MTRERVDPRADLISGSTPGVLLADLDGCDGLILLGYHAKAGTPGAVCEHTMSSVTWQNLWINGRLKVRSVFVPILLANTKSLSSWFQAMTKPAPKVLNYCLTP